MPLKVQRGLITLDGDTEVRTETLFGREFQVYPVVAMVEGVRFGANQDTPELGLASDFGEIPVLWNNKPIVLNHPKKDGVFVSAQEGPDILEEYAFGITMNATVDGEKLKMEAWIDTERVEELGGEFVELSEKIADGETVEVSVGFFSEVLPKKGKFKGQAYSGIWKNIRPDHLAILSEDSIGACSIEDGCGIPRINKDKEKSVAKILQADSGVTTDEPETQEAGGCSCGGHSNNGKKKKSTASVPETQSSQPLTFEQEEAIARAEQRDIIQFAVNLKLRDLGVDPALLDSDVRKLLNRALSKAYGSYVYVYGFTTDNVIFEKYDYDVSRGGYTTYQQGFSIAESKVTFVGDPEEVVLLTKIVPQSQSENPDSDPEGTVDTQENQMTKPNTQSAAPTSSDDPKSNEVQSSDLAAQAAQAALAAQAAAPVVEAAPKVLSAEEYIAQAPAEIRDVLASSMRMHSERKKSLIETLVKHPKNQFDQAYYEGQSLEVLEKMSQFFADKPSYAGVAPANQPHLQAANPGGAGGPQYVEAPKVFEKKTAA